MNQIGVPQNKILKPERIWNAGKLFKVAGKIVRYARPIDVEVVEAHIAVVVKVE